MYPDTSIPYEQVVSGYNWIQVDTCRRNAVLTTILSPIQDTCRRRRAIQVNKTYIRATCIRCKRGIKQGLLQYITGILLLLILTRRDMPTRNKTTATMDGKNSAYSRSRTAAKL